MAAVAATDALVAIQRSQPTVAWLPATTATIQRQQAAWYRKAVAAADAGLSARALKILEGNRAVLDVTIRDKPADVAKAFCQAFGRGCQLFGGYSDQRRSRSFERGNSQRN
jgi:hypothetical protein